MDVMRRLLVDAQAKFSKMMGDNKALACRIDQDIQFAHLQVSQLRAELADTNQRLNDICGGKVGRGHDVMAGNVITTCMPPTSTTSTVTNSNDGSHWSRGSQSFVESVPKRDVSSSGPLADTKIPGCKPIMLTNQYFHGDPGKVSGKEPQSVLRAFPNRAGFLSAPSSRQGSKDKPAVAPRSNSEEHAAEISTDGTEIHRDFLKREKEKMPSAKSQTFELKREAAVTSSPKYKTLLADSEVCYKKDDISTTKLGVSSEKNESTDKKSALFTTQDSENAQTTGPGNYKQGVSPSKSKEMKPSSSRKVDHPVVKTFMETEITSVITKETYVVDQSKYKSVCQTSRDGSWIRNAFEPPVVKESRQGPGTSGETKSGVLSDQSGVSSHKDSMPYQNSWCSDTGDSVSDIITSDDCTRDQNDVPEAERLPDTPPKIYQEAKRRLEDQNEVETSGYGKDTHYSSYGSGSKQESPGDYQHHPERSEDHESLKIKCSALQRDLEEVMESRDEKAKENANMAAKLEGMDKELKLAKEALSALKQDRKRLKAEKFDLLTQMKQLYSTLEDKEGELREFIRNYEQKIKDSDETIKQLRKEREEVEKEKWSILQRARDEAERCVHLCTQIGLKDSHIKELQEELSVYRDIKHYSGEDDIHHANGYGSPGSVSYRTVNGIDSRGTPTPTPGSDPPTTSPSYAGTPTVTAHHSGHKDSGSGEDRRPPLLSRSAEDIFGSGRMDQENPRRKTFSAKLNKLKGKKGTWGSISRVFSRNKNRRKALEPDLFHNNRSSWSPKGSVCSSSPLSEESYHQKLRLLEETRGSPMEHWRAATVLAWLEITMDMPQYGNMCAENIKSGKVLLELSDVELEEGLGISNVMHRRKLRLAIEENREPSLCRYPKICFMTYSWVVDEWLNDIALTCYLPSFSEHLVDGRVLDTVTRKDLEKYFGITRKFHQMSIIHGIHLLQMAHYDRQVLNQRRMNSDNMDVDPVVWTNQRFMKWAASIDLGEYAENLRNSGVHGALVVLESSFTADTMATALGIPASKNIIRRHLTTEWQNLIQPARLSLESESLVARKSKSGRRLVSGSSSTSLASQGGKSTGGIVQTYARKTLDRYDRRRTSWRFSTWRSSQESLKSTSSKKTTAHQQPITQHQMLPQLAVERPRVLPLSPNNMYSTRHRRTYSSHSDVETLTVTPV